MPSIFDLIDNDRSIFLFDSIHSFSSEFLIRDLLKMNEESKDKSINIFINSDGGDVIDTFGIVDVMKSIQAPINTIILGSAASAAALIAAHGNKRFVSANSEIMIHEAALRGFGFIDTRDDKFNDALKRLKEINDKVNTLFAQVTNKSNEEIEKILSTKDDIFMTAKEAIKFGLADEILTPEQLNKIKLSEQFKTYKFSEEINPYTLKEDGDLKIVHLLKVCSLEERGVKITSDTLKTIVTNFDNNVRGQDISIEYNTHDNDDGQNPAAGWFKELFIGGDKDLFGKVKYSPTAKKMIEDREYKYISVEIDPLYLDEKGKMYNDVLLGATFTNRPAVKGLNPLKLSENINNNQKTDMDLNKTEITSIESLKKEGIEIKDFHKSYIEMKKHKDAFETENKKLIAGKEALETEAKTAKETLSKLEKEQVDSEKNLVVDSLISKGIIITANKDKVLKQFSSKKDIEEFYKGTPAAVSVRPQGSDVEDPDPDSDNKIKAKELAKQTSQSEEDLLETIKSRTKD